MPDSVPPTLPPLPATVAAPYRGPTAWCEGCVSAPARVVVWHRGSAWWRLCDSCRGAVDRALDDAATNEIAKLDDDDRDDDDALDDDDATNAIRIREPNRNRESQPNLNRESESRIESENQTRFRFWTNEPNRREGPRATDWTAANAPTGAVGTPGSTGRRRGRTRLGGSE